MSIISKSLKFSLLASVFVSLLLAGCAVPPMAFPAALRLKVEPEPESAQAQEPGMSKAESARLSVTNAPTPETAGSALSAVTPSTGAAGGETVTVNVEQMSIKAFTQFVFGNLLKKTVALDSKLAQRTDLITLRTDHPQTPRQVAETAKLLLQGYGVSVTEFDSLVRVNPTDAKGGDLPLFRRGRASSETPAALRPVFHLVELEVTRSGEVITWIKTMFGNKVELQDVTSQNSILVSGAPENVTAALEIVRALDAPRMRGRVAKRLTPAFLSATELVTRLNDVLTAQGYAVAGQASGSGTSAIVMVPVVSLNTVFVFTTSQAVAEFVVKWAAEVDQVSPKTGSAGFISYPVKYSDAQTLAKTMSDLMAAGSVVPSAAGAGKTVSRVIVNSATNSLIIQGGSSDEHRQWRALLQELDRPVKSALIDVVVAELTLGTKEQLGVEWQMADQTFGAGVITGGTLGALGIGSGGLGLSFLNNAGQVRGLLNFLGSSSNARILSSPKVLARNAETATIQVGQEVPIVTSQQSGTPATGVTTAGILQTIQYRSTGVILRVKPIILAGGRLDLEVTQEVSSAAETTTGVSTSPTISSRKVETKLSLRDGGTVMLAGLISSDSSKGNSGIPGLKDVPGLGNLFKTEKDSSNKTELVILITAHVLNDDFESEAITDSFRRSLSQWLEAPGGMAPVKAPKSGPSPRAVTEAVPELPASSKQAVDVVVPRQTDPQVIEVPVASKRPGDVPTAVQAGSISQTSLPVVGSGAPQVPESNKAKAASSQLQAPMQSDGGPGKLVTDPALLEELKRSIRQ